jgi:hypothetical protein
VAKSELTWSDVQIKRLKEHKYVYIVSDKAGVFLNKFSLAFPKKA